MIENIKNTKALLMDLDGTVYLDGELIGGVKETLSAFRRKGVRIIYLSNNSSRTDDEYYKKLKDLSILEKEDVFYSSLTATADYLIREYAGKTVYPVCTEKVAGYLSERGIELSDNADIVLLTFDRELTYKKMERANYLIGKGAVYIATHPDKTCPAKEIYVPDAGAFIEALYASSNRRPDVIIGKPQKVMAEEIIRMTGLKRSEITVVGDRLYTDMAFGINNRFNTVLVISGETGKQDLCGDIKPDLVIEDVNSLTEYI